MNQINKAEQIAKLKKQVEALQRTIESMENNKSCLIRSPDASSTYEGAYIIGRDEIFDFEIDYVATIAGCTTMHFLDEDQCKRYANALTTFILLRKQPGSEVAVEGRVQYLIGVNYAGEICVHFYEKLGNKVTEISPCFDSVQSAWCAVEVLGKDRILNMFKYFHS